MKVEKGRIHLIKPTAQVPTHFVALSNSDLTYGNVHVHIIYAYGDPSPPPPVLQSSLVEVLDEYREFAGRLAEDPSGRPGISLIDDGVFYCDASTKCSIEEIYPFYPSPMLLELVPSVEGAADQPLLIQVTRFACGGMTVGLAIHHRVADGDSISKFLLAWAGACRGLPITPVLHDRSALFPRQPPTPIFDHVQYQKSKVMLEPGMMPPPLSSPVIITNVRLHFNPEMLRKLKLKSGKYTTLESLTAHLWRCVIKACGDLGGGTLNTSEMRVILATSGRKRLIPNIADNYFGNVMFLACAQTQTKQVLSEPLSFAAAKIHQSIKMLDDKYLRSALDYIEVQRQSCLAVVAMDQRKIMVKFNMIVTSWVHLCTYELDFGSGPPIYVGPPVATLNDDPPVVNPVMILLPSYTKDGSIDVVTGLSDVEVYKLASICYEIS